MDIEATIFAVGQNDDGQLGIYNNEYDGGIPCTTQFKLVNFSYVSETGTAPPNIVKLACGGMHTLALTDKGQIISWGAMDFIGRQASEESNWKPQFIEIPHMNIEFVDIACGECYSAALDQSGKVWTWGSFRDTAGTEHYNGTTKRNQIPSLLVLPTNVAVVSISVGESHFIALCSNGCIYGWGINSHAQLGYPSSLDQQNEFCSGVPMVAPSNFSPLAIYACGFSSFITGEFRNGEKGLFACGGNGFGELGVGHEKPCWYLTEVLPMRKRSILDIKGGLHHTVILCGMGDVFVSGRGDSGQLGLGPILQQTNVFQILSVPNARGIACSTSGDQTCKL
ncbi:regulator of chromosome condensation 1/beta-lactamase-inhibitor protein II [Obelidium mucronatum]|nr:regulator of chromosome condensation 1/beta-lactamase-inhibitor protein II [Obelidium mucronatum]